MLGKRKKASNSSTTLISKGTEIVGNLNFEGHLEIEGIVKGNITATGDDAFVRILEQGKVEGQLEVPSVVINGAVVGDVHSNKHLVLAEHAEVSGDVHYSVIEMAKGAHVNGSLVYRADAAQKAPITKDNKVAPIEKASA